jgi:hypothetical protein
MSDLRLIAAFLGFGLAWVALVSIQLAALVGVRIAACAPCYPE